MNPDQRFAPVRTRILAHIGAHPGKTANRLSIELCVFESTVRNLARDGFIVGQRGRGYTLTEKGCQALAAHRCDLPRSEAQWDQ